MQSHELASQVGLELANMVAEERAASERRRPEVADHAVDVPLLLTRVVAVELDAPAVAQQCLLEPLANLLEGGAASASPLAEVTLDYGRHDLVPILRPLEPSSDPTRQCDPTPGLQHLPDARQHEIAVHPMER